MVQDCELPSTLQGATMSVLDATIPNRGQLMAEKK